MFIDELFPREDGLGAMEPSHVFLRNLFTAVRGLSDGLMTVDRENRVTYLNPAAEFMTGWSLDEALGKPSGIVFRVVNAVTGEASWQPITPAMSENRPYVLLPHSVLIRKDQTELPIDDTVNPLHNEAGEVDGAVITFRDLGRNVALIREVLERTRLDALTGLANRNILEEHLSQSMTPVATAFGPVLLFLDLDRFKEINDTFGHGAGDLVLQTTAKRLRAAVPGDAIVCRLGGDEFVVLLDSLPTLDAARHCVECVLRELQAPILVAGVHLQATISLGVAVGGASRVGHQELMSLADQAMYRAKQAGGNRAEWTLLT